ncbi:molybdate ABC transporter substrate-binding protein [Phenylobacterium sp.]|jgi:molybdate transport system substrate-binding protein|uniref:molybdate ABC transporter substrate-binding protein n=1 Tax=Phenylobacterium sp. TaxID=1871053 RepID=UPI002E323168|nr:molybdate ABC transporter substrate-binding protein [Phenylobacterium sp.]HEX2561421.1 molybdate ABC transporter substrate-binding protein [Phenylobacterium sp.]
MTDLHRRRALGAGLAAAGQFLLAAPARARAPVTVFAAASLQNALNDVGAAYTRGTGQPVRFSYAASSAIARQIEQGAPADLFVSADREWMDYVAHRGLIQPASRRDLLAGRLVLIAPARSKVQLAIRPGMPLARTLGRGRLAMAAPDVPAGRYGRAALTRLGVWKSVEGRIAPAENVRSALQFVARGEAPLGIVYETDAKLDRRVRIVSVFPPSSHPPIVYPAALTSRGARNRAAGGFLAYLSGPEATAVFRRYGFSVTPSR